MNLEGRPSLCRSCGAIVGAGQTSCAVCGAELTASAPRESQPRRSYEDDARRFARAVLNRSYLFTILFLIANFFVFLLMWQSSGMSSGALAKFPSPVLIAYGAKLNFLIHQNREWWRFVTPVFIHVNLWHLLVNMYSLWMIGPYVEKLYGSAKFVVFWVATGVAGVIASYLTLQPRLARGPLGSFVFKASDFPSAGASGALFGLVGVLFVFGIKFRRELPEGFRRAFGTGLLPVILINLAIGYMLRGFIDNAAHLGGLFSGAALALVVDYKRPGERAAITFTWRALQILALALIAISFFMAARHMRNAGPSVATLTPSTTEPSSAENAYSDALNKGAEAVANALNRHANQEMLTGAQQALDNVVGPDEPSERLRNELKALIVRAQEIGATPPSQPGSRKAMELRKKLFEDFEAWIKKRDEWVAGPGASLGMRLVERSEENSASPAMPATSPNERVSPR